MAVFLVRAFDIPQSSVDFFEDDGDSIFESEINALASAGVTRGCNPPENDMFCPDRTLTRGEMAVFLVRVLGLELGAPDYFLDDDGSSFEAEINAIASIGVTRGCNPPTNDRYCPGADVTREQMASFIVRALPRPDPVPRSGR